jgi:hypothetical protein
LDQYMWKNGKWVDCSNGEGQDWSLTMDDGWCNLEGFDEVIRAWTEWQQNDRIDDVTRVSSTKFVYNSLQTLSLLAPCSFYSNRYCVLYTNVWLAQLGRCSLQIQCPKYIPWLGHCSSFWDTVNFVRTIQNR